MRSGSAPTLALGLALLVPSLARAGNEAHPRTPVLWPSSGCGQVIVRGEQPIVHFEYSIAAEDTQIGPDELVDSRTHQFFAVCRQRPVSELLPNWISVDDVDRATQAGLIAGGSVPASEVLDTSATWADCSLRITADDDRRPISFAVADAGFDWDLTEVPVGVWQIAGYTFEPPLNLWRARPGFVKIVDDPDDPEQDLPAAAIRSTDDFWATIAFNPLSLCVDVLTPATAIIEWSRFAPVLDWQSIDEQTLEHEGTIEWNIPGPFIAEGVDVEGLLRVRVIDALGREVIAEAANTIVFRNCNGECGSPPPPVDDPPPDDPIVSDDACACALDSPARAWPLSWLLLTLVGLRRRLERRS